MTRFLHEKWLDDYPLKLVYRDHYRRSTQKQEVLRSVWDIRLNIYKVDAHTDIQFQELMASFLCYHPKKPDWLVWSLASDSQFYASSLYRKIFRDR
ncbi:hypothetical protein AMTR_s00109p00124990 [Amborella trichopoda]|uniref:Uncharacterized protein n=1 Tax=Amborella trichopoda TaxID=13333 RepID=W1NPM2_AMBTC|nr:hypothetical protein AMTR_s00109p00124990 [Amborella trichopoda]